MEARVVAGSALWATAVQEAALASPDPSGLSHTGKMVRYGYSRAVASLGGMSRDLECSLLDLATLLGRLEETVRHFLDAVRQIQPLASRLSGVETPSSEALSFVGRAESDDGGHATNRSAASTPTDVDARTVGNAARELLASLELRGGSAPMTKARRADAGIPTFRREGEYWTVRFDGDEFRLKDSKGLRYLAPLLAGPGEEIHALELVSTVEGVESERHTPIGEELAGSEMGNAGPVLDAPAKASYRARISELEAEVEEARCWNDPEREAQARQELEFVAEELASAVGLGGRDRKAACAAERARVNVTKAIRCALARIAQHSAALGRHLNATLRTGFFCSYQPDPMAPVNWQM